MCDTFVALPPATADGSVIFAKNSDRPCDEVQPVRRYPHRQHAPGTTLRCTYIEIPQVPITHAVILSQPDWMWGAEMGANEHGVVIGNEAVWTREALGPPALLGMDLVRLGLERGATAREALDVITTLLVTHGQGGACAEHDASFVYHNGFLIADAREAWVLETADRCWAAERITGGTRNISNGLSIRNRFDLASDGLVDHAQAHGYHTGPAPFDFAAAFGGASGTLDPTSRDAWGARLLTEQKGRITPDSMMDILRHHDSGICMHGGFATTASMVSRLLPDGTAEHWLTGGPHPCQRSFQTVDFTSENLAQPA